MQLLTATSSRFVEANGTYRRRLDCAQSRRLLSLWGEASGSAAVCRETHASIEKCGGCGHSRAQEAFLRRTDRRYSSAGWTSQPDESPYRSPGFGGRVSTGKNLADSAGSKDQKGIDQGKGHSGSATDHKISLSSPRRRVTRSRSRYSSSGIAYLRETPASSLNFPTSIFADLAL